MQIHSNLLCIFPIFYPAECPLRPVHFRGMVLDSETERKVSIVIKLDMLHYISIEKASYPGDKAEMNVDCV